MENSEKDLLAKLDYEADSVLNSDEKLTFKRLIDKGIIKNCTAVPSPALLKSLDKQIYFLVINANNSTDFDRIEKKLKSDWSNKISSYTLIGDSDFLLRICGNDYFVDRIRDEFGEFSSRISECRVEDTLLSWGVVVPECAKKQSNSQLPEKIKLIEELQENCKSDKIAETHKRELIDDGLIIKYTVLKDYEKIHLEKAFVIICLPPRGIDKNRIEEVLLRPETTGISRDDNYRRKLPIITGVYRVSGDLGNYLLEGQFENVYDFHSWMDSIYSKLTNIDSLTLFSDSCVSELIDSVKGIEYPSSLKDYGYLGQTYRDTWIRVSILLSEQQKSKFSQLNVKRQLQILSVYEKIKDLYQKIDFEGKDAEREAVEKAVNDILKAMVSESRADYRAIMGPVVILIEDCFNDFALPEINKKFPSSLDEAQHTLGISKSDFGQLLLNPIIMLLRNWNNKYSDDLIVSPDTVIRLDKIADVRNYSSHGKGKREKRPYRLTWKDSLRWEEDIVDAFCDLLYILRDAYSGNLKPKT